VYSSPAYWTWAAIVSVIGVGVAWRESTRASVSG